jgi:hypothetical protein
MTGKTIGMTPRGMRYFQRKRRVDSGEESKGEGHRMDVTIATMTVRQTPVRNKAEALIKKICVKQKPLVIWNGSMR